MNYRELASKVRNKFPGQYDDLDDESLARKIVAEYPEYSDVEFTTSLAAKASSGVVSDVTPSKEGFLSRLARGTGEMLKTPIAPFLPGLRKRLFAPVAGQAGVSRTLEEEGKGVGSAVRASTANLRGKYPLASEIPGIKAPLAIADLASNMLTPSEMQANIGAEGIGIGLRAATPEIVKGTSKISELLTGTDASNFRRLAEDPKAILPSWLGGPKSRRAAGAELGAAEREAGFLPGESSLEKGEGLKQFAGETSPFKGDQGIADSYFERVAKGEKLSPQEGMEAYKSTSRVLNKMSRKDARYVRMTRFREALGKELESLSPAYSRAKKEFARSAMGEAVSNILPRTKTGKPSIGRLAAGSLLFGGGIINPSLAIAATAASPLVHGIGTAALAGAGRVAPGFLSTIQKAARNYLGGGGNTPNRSVPSKPRELQKPSRPGGFGISKASASPRIQERGSAPAPSAPTAAPSNGDGYYNQAVNYFLNGDIQKAADLAYQAVQKNPSNRDAQRLLERLVQKGAIGYRVETRVKKE